jgi:hypothetical protein
MANPTGRSPLLALASSPCLQRAVTGFGELRNVAGDVNLLRCARCGRVVDLTREKEEALGEVPRWMN